MKLRTALSYDDVLLVPKYSKVISRKDITLESVLDEARNLKFPRPIITSPMDTITEDKMAIQIAKLGGLGIIHRYNTKEQQLEIFLKALKEIPNTQVGVAIGITGDALERATLMTSNGCKILCVDVAHGHLNMVGGFIKTLKAWIPKDVHVMAGNIATPEGAKFLEDAGADSLRVSVGSGCFTPDMKVNTENGLKDICDVNIGDKVYTHTGELKEVIGGLSYHTKEHLYKINDIECTKNHEFYVVHKDDVDKLTDENVKEYAKWIPAEKLDKDNHLLVSLMKFKLIKIESVETFEYDGNVYDLTVKDDHSYNINNIVVHNSICSTRIQTGHGIPVWQSIADIVERGGVSIPLIADGGIKNSGDLSKAIAVGADFGMVGSLVSGTTETPGALFTKEDGSKFKCYRGMASREAQKDWRGTSASVEGISTFVRFKGPVESIIMDLDVGLRSALSYSGAFDIKEFQRNAEFVIQTSGGQFESSTHILSKV